MSFGSERFKLCEALFNPQMMGMNEKVLGVHRLLDETIMKCDGGIRELLLSNVVLNGGNTMFDGFETRLLKEMHALFGRLRKQEVVVDGYIRRYNTGDAIMYQDMKDVVGKYVSPRIEIIAAEYRKYRYSICFHCTSNMVLI